MLDGQGYIVNEQVYAKNLRIERSLRRQGWGIFRYANVELRNEDATGSGFVRLIKSAQLPSFLYETFFSTSIPTRRASAIRRWLISWRHIGS